MAYPSINRMLNVFLSSYRLNYPLFDSIYEKEQRDSCELHNLTLLTSDTNCKLDFEIISSMTSLSTKFL